MPIVRSTHLYELIARVGVDPGSGYGRLVDMHAVRIERLVESGQPTREFLLPPVSVSWLNLVQLMHEDDRAALQAALTAVAGGS